MADISNMKKNEENCQHDPQIISKSREEQAREWWQPQMPSAYIMDNYRGAAKYNLNLVNSIILHDCKIYDLLEKITLKRRMRCGCLKSNCDARYCQCYRAGETCGQDCSCIGCRNRKVRRSGTTQKQQESSSCNCVKSNCLKKYCECYQNGRKCNQRCRCCDCKNYEQNEDQ